MPHPRRLLIALLTVAVLLGVAQLVRAQTGRRVYLPSLSVPPGVVVLSSKIVTVPGVSFYLVGEVQNQATEPAYNVRLATNFLVYPSNVPAVAAGAALLSYVAPGQTMPFEIDLSGRNTLDYTVRVTSWETTSTAAIQVLTVVRQELRKGVFDNGVLVELRNDGQQSVRNVRIAVTFYGASGSVEDVTVATAPDTFSPGQVRSYRVNVIDDSTIEFATTVQAYAQGEPFVPSPTPEPTAEPTPDPSRCHPSYPTVCIRPPPPDLDCGDIPYRRFTVLPPDPHNFDTDGDGVGCES